MRIILKWLTSRLMIVAPLIAMQFLLFVSLVYSVSIGYKVFPIVEACAVIAVLYIINRQLDPYYKLAWCCLILGLPVVGLPLYFLAGERHVPKKIQNGTILADRKMAGLLVSRDHVQDRQDAEEDVVPIMRYCEECGFPVYRNTDIQYYSTGEEWYEAYLEELCKAKHYIFMEFFIIRKGQCWSEVLDILKQKIAEGVEVKIIYDDFGSVEMPIHYDRKLGELGIEAHRFNHIRPAFIIQMNNRDHRKITIIDNKVAFTGGVNLADEYANKIKRFGYWKDSAIRLEGDAVWSLTVMFLGLLTHVRGDSGEPIDYQKYRITHEPVQADSFVQPYSDSPTDDEPVCLNMHLNMVNHARDYIYIDTPYLILNETMKNALILAARSGVDVRILTPGKPDKIIVNQMTKGNYLPLLKAGVKIYEYTPGFNHAKNFVADDRMAVVGTANMDYRSYFLHFENGVFLYRDNEVLKIREDFMKSLENSREITIEEMNQTFILVRLFRALLTVFIPLV